MPRIWSNQGNWHLHLITHQSFLCAGKLRVFPVLLRYIINGGAPSDCLHMDTLASTRSRDTAAHLFHNSCLPIPADPVCGSGGPRQETPRTGLTQSTLQPRVSLRGTQVQSLKTVTSNSLTGFSALGFTSTTWGVRTWLQLVVTEASRVARPLSTTSLGARGSSWPSGPG